VFGKALETLGQLRGEYPNLRVDIKRVIAEGDMVVTHSHLDLEPGNAGHPGRALADLFRLEDGKDVHSPPPVTTGRPLPGRALVPTARSAEKKSIMQNERPMPMSWRTTKNCLASLWPEPGR
jgi:hypothetical protein